MDSLIDVIATIALDPAVPAVSGEAALAATPATRRVGSKPFSIEGYNLHSLVWESPMPGQRYGGFQAGVQLANRSGPLNEIEYSEFVVKTQAFADAVNATPEFPEMLEEVARARELDQFCQRARRPARLHHSRAQRLLEPRLRSPKCVAPGFCPWGHPWAHGVASLCRWRAAAADLGLTRKQRSRRTLRSRPSAS